MAETLAPVRQETQNDHETDDQRIGFLTRTRQAVTNEMKLTFTLPDPRSSGIIETGKDLFWKGMGLAGVYMGQWLFQAGEHGNMLHEPGDTEQTIHHIREAVEGVGVGTVALGALAIFLTNRKRGE